MQQLSTKQNLPSEENSTTTPPPNPRRTMGRNQHWPHWTTSPFKWERRHTSHCRSLLKNDMTIPNNDKPQLHGPRTDISRWDLEATWNTMEHHQRPRTTVRIRIHKEPTPGTGNHTKTVNSIPPTDRWTNRTYQPGNRRIPMNILQLPTGWLDTLATYGRIPLQRQTT